MAARKSKKKTDKSIREKSTPKAPAPLSSPLIFSRLFTALFIILLLAATGYGVWTYLSWGKAVSGREVDDAGITFAFANHLAQGYGIVLYPGGERVEGYSNPTWMFLLALGNKLGLDVFYSAKVLGYFLGALCIAILALFAWSGLPHGRSWPLIAVPVFAATHSTLAIWSMTGLETSLYILLIIASSLRLFIECDQTKSRWPISPILFFLLSVTRPEGIVFFFFAICYRIIALIIPRRKIVLKDIIWFGFFLGPWIAYQIWHYIYFAWPLPNTYYGKVIPRTWADIFSTQSYGFGYIESFFLTYKIYWLLMLVPFAFLVKGGKKRALYIFAVLAFSVFFPLYANGDWMRGWRFCAPVAPILFLLAAMGAEGFIQGILSLLQDRVKPVIKQIIAIVLSMAFLFTGMLILYPASKTMLKTYAKKPAARIKGIKRRTDFFRKAARKLRFMDFEATFADMDMGSVALYSKMKIIDLGRICNIPIAHNFGNKLKREMFMEEYVLKENPPDFTHIRKAWGRETTLLGNGKYVKNYFYLPEKPKVSKPPGGNYVRRDLIIFDHPPKPSINLEFDQGMTLLFAKLNQEVSRRNSNIWLRLFWRRNSIQKLREMKFRIILEDVGGNRRTLKPYTPVMDFYPTSNWEPGQTIGEWVKIKIPKTTGRGKYRIIFQAMDEKATEVLEEKPLDAWVTVDGHLAGQLGDMSLLKALKMAEKGLIADAYRTFDQANEYWGDLIPQTAIGRLEKAVCKGALIKADELIKEGSPDKAGDILLLARQRFSRDKGVNKLLWKLSKEKVKAGKAAMTEKNWEAAFNNFNRGAQLQPWNSWARKYAEQVRLLRYN